MNVLLLLISVSIIVSANATRFSGYHVNFYQNLSFFTITLLILGFIIFHYIFYLLYRGGYKYGGDICGGIVSILIFTVTAVFLPRIVGYQLSHSDPASHFQTISLIFNYYRLPKGGNLIYPIMHTHVGTLAKVSGLSPVVAYSISGVVYYVTIVLGSLFVLNHFVSEKRPLVLGAWISVSVIPFAWFPRTRILGYLVALFWIGTALRLHQDERWSILSPFLTIILVLAHLLAAIMTVLYVGISGAVYHKGQIWESKFSRVYLLLLICLTTWILLMELLPRAVLPFFTDHGNISIALGSVLSLGSALNYTTVDYIILLVSRLGGLIIISIISATFFILQTTDRWKGPTTLPLFHTNKSGLKEGRERDFNYFSAAIPAIGLGGALQFATATVQLTGLRIFNILVYLVPVYLIYITFRLKPGKEIAMVSIILLSTVAGLHAYPNNVTKDPSPFITESDEAGISWFLNSKDRDIQQRTLIISLHRRYGYLMSPEDRHSRALELRDYRPPSDVDYEHQTLSEIFGEPTYVVLNKRDRQTYQHVFGGWRYGSSFFSRVQTGPTSHQIYSNGNVHTYLTSESHNRNLEQADNI
jgi:hypothetical protein